MSRKLLIPLLAAAFLAAPAFVPAAMTGLSDSATAAPAVQSSKSQHDVKLRRNKRNAARHNERGRGGKPKALEPTGNVSPGGY